MQKNNLKRFKNKKIAILGYGIENQALVEFLIKNNVECEVAILNATENILPAINALSKKRLKKTVLYYQIGSDYDKGLDQYDMVSRVAGYPLFTKETKRAMKAGVEVTSPTKLFFDLCPTKNIIGVTGTKGKGTTSSLIVAILKAAKKRVYFGGNIGIPMFSFLDRIKKTDFVVLELSSFQLEDLHKSPHIAVFINFSKDHLSSADPQNPNHHKSMATYFAAKANIFTHQKAGDYLILNSKFKIKNRNTPQPLSKGELIEFGKSDLKSKLVGEHNKENIAAAVEVAKILKIDEKIVVRAAKWFKGLEHRIEFVGEKKGVRYYDDSFATTPEAAITALQSFDSPIVLLAGGADKGADFKIFAQEIKRRVKHLILFAGRGSERIKSELKIAKYDDKKVKTVYNMGEAIKSVNKVKKPGDVVLLSTGCASFGVFKNYKERGDLFKKAV